jgi:pimeloyl-ACP methyl ester carboxylesterase
MSFERHTANLSKGEVTYFTAGEGAPVVYLHGRGGLLKSKAHEILAEKFKLYLPVAPGFDGTEFLDGIDSMPALAALTAEFIDTIVEEPCDVVGHSLGGWHACWVAVNHPDKVELLVLAAPAGFRPNGAGANPSSYEELLKIMTVYPEKQPDDDRSAEMIRHNREKVPHHYHKGMPLDEDLVARLGDIQSSTLLVHGTEETLIPLETCRILKEKVPRIYLNYIYDASHNIEVDQPERFAALVGDFLARGEAFLVNPGDEAAA